MDAPPHRRVSAPVFNIIQRIHMQRRSFIRNTLGTTLAALPVIKSLRAAPKAGAQTPAPPGGSIPGLPATHAPVASEAKAFVTSGPPAPVTFYNDWSSYDELSDNTPLTETLAMRELQEVVRLQQSGVHFDYYMMDAFWFDKMGGYRTWHKEHWPNGPDAWLNACKAAGIKPGMWFSTNLIATHSGRFLEVIPEWQDSLATDGGTLCLFTGGYLRHLGETLQIWYDKGVRAFKFDFAYFSAATRAVQEVHLPGSIEEMNKLALMDMLQQFRNRNPDVLITGYNGFGGDMENSFTPFRKTVDPRWLDVFDTIYCGDPRFSDVPTMNIWRSQDIYTDHMVRQFEFNGMPLRRIDNCGFMTGKTGTCYYRGDHAWKGMLIMELARSGWMNVYHGNMELITGEGAPWFAKVQGMYHNLQQYGLCSTFGAIPGTAQPYGFKAEGINGTVLTLVNPSQAIVHMDLPARESSGGKVLYADGGFSPVLQDRDLQLGPEQMVIVGFGEYANEKYDLGVDDTIHIPKEINPVDASFSEAGLNSIRATVNAPGGKHIRILFQQFGPDGFPRRSWGGSPPDGKKMDAFLQISVTQGKKTVPLHIEYDKMIWSGLSWGAAEIVPGDWDAARPLEVQCHSTEAEKLQLKAHIYAVTY